MSNSLLTISTVAERMNVSTKTVRRLARSGRLPFLRIGERGIRFDPSDIEQYLANSRVGL